MRTSHLVAAAWTILLFAAPAAGQMTRGERQRLVVHFEMTNAWLESEVTGLSDAQLKFRMTPESWSIMDVVEHLAIAEPQYWKNFQDSLAKPIQRDFKPRATDESMLWYGIDRTERATTGDARVPKGTYATVGDALAAFRTLRGEMLQFAKTSQDDLRHRPYMTASQDLYQWLLMISTHSQRHVLQIREIKAHPGYPASSREVQAAPRADLSTTSGGLTSLYRSIRLNLVEAAEAMPEEHYAFRPTDDVRTFGQLVGHVTNTHYNFCAPARGVANPNRMNVEATLTTKAELVAALRASVEFCDPAYETLTDEGMAAPARFGQTAISAGYPLIFNVAHDNEHYGNLVTYMRLKGLVPPSTARQRR